MALIEAGTYGEIDEDSSDNPLLRDTNANVEVLIKDIPTSGGDADTFFSSGHTNFPTGNTNQELHRFELQSGETLTMEDLQFQQKSGGSEVTDASVEVVDVTTSTTLASANLNTLTVTSSESGDGNTIIVRWNNSSGTDYQASITARGYIN